MSTPFHTIDNDDTERRQKFTLDQVGNWDEFKKDDDGSGGNGGSAAWDLDQNRAHNKANEIANHGGDPIWPEPNNGTPDWTDPDYDARGNTTKAPVPGDEANHHYNCTYDAWNRLVKVQDDTPTTVAEYRYDGAARRIAKLIPNGSNWDRTDYYHDGVQVVEERFAANQAAKDDPATLAKYQYVWGVRYVHSLVLRDEDTDADGDCTDPGGSERLYYCSDANFNVTALVDTGGSAVERYMYDPYGKRTILNPSWNEIAWGASEKNPILYTGHRWDNETGLYYAGYRYYHPTLGRWLQRDPLGYTDAMSLYEYVAGEPVASLDPYGDGIEKDKICSGKKASDRAKAAQSRADKWEFGARYAAIFLSMPGGPSPLHVGVVKQETRNIARLAYLGFRAFWPGGTDPSTSNAFVYTCKEGWIDAGHYFLSAFAAYVGGGRFAIERGLAIERDQQREMDQQARGAKKPDDWGPSAYTPEDLWSNLLGAKAGEDMRKTSGFGQLRSALLEYGTTVRGARNPVTHLRAHWRLTKKMYRIQRVAQPYDIAGRYEKDLRDRNPVNPGNWALGGHVARYWLELGADWSNRRQMFTFTPVKMPWHRCVCDENDEPIGAAAGGGW